jgi:hypothetical protein
MDTKTHNQKGKNYLKFKLKIFHQVNKYLAFFAKPRKTPALQIQTGFKSLINLIYNKLGTSFRDYFCENLMSTYWPFMLANQIPERQKREHVNM